MDVYGKIAKSIRELGGGSTNAQIFPAKIKSIDGTKCSILIGQLELSDVRLRAVINNEDDKILVTPKVGSQVLVADLSGGNYRDLAVMKYSEVEKIEIKVANMEVVVNGGKISIKNASQNLYDLLVELIDAINALTVTTATGPSGTPINAVQFSAVKTKLGQLMQ